MTLIIICIALFAVAGSFGIINFVTHAGGGQPSRLAGDVHGAMALASLALVATYSFRHPSAAPDWAFSLLVIAALAGFVFFGIDVARRKPPQWLGFIHGAIALA